MKQEQVEMSLDMVLTVPADQVDMLARKFVDWVEQNGWSCGGGIKPYEEGSLPVEPQSGAAAYRIALIEVLKRELDRARENGNAGYWIGCADTLQWLILKVHEIPTRPEHHLAAASSPKEPVAPTETPAHLLLALDKIRLIATCALPQLIVNNSPLEAAAQQQGGGDRVVEALRKSITILVDSIVMDFENEKDTMWRNPKHRAEAIEFAISTGFAALAAADSQKGAQPSEVAPTWGVDLSPEAAAYVNEQSLEHYRSEVAKLVAAINGAMRFMCSIPGEEEKYKAVLREIDAALAPYSLNPSNDSTEKLDT